MKIKSFIICILSLIFILLFTCPIAYAEIDNDVDNDDLDFPTTVTQSTTTASKSVTTTKSSKVSNTSGKKGGSVETTTEESTTENETSEPDESTTAAGAENCEHNFVIVGFDCDYGLATIRCTRCKYTYTDYFADHVTSHKVPGQNPENYDPVFDVVNDGVINGKDYAYLLQQYYEDFYVNSIFDSHEFLFKEQFGYIYLTVLMIVSSAVICLTIRRCC